MEENKRFSWTDLFIKIILVIIFVLFTIWLLSLSTNGLSNSLDVLTNNIFSENMEKMKEVGKEYFTIERLPEKVGEVETLTLEDMYEKKLILELTDKNGNACSAKDSYVSIEKYDNEYQMKVYLECGEESDYIIVIMGCYDYCDTDICELDTEKEETKETEYEYKKLTGGHWTDWGKWSEWSKVSVTKTDYRQVETKVETEEYSYDKTITEFEYAEFEASCPKGYTKTSDGTKCYKTVIITETANPVCPTVSGYTLVSQDGFNCNYSKTTTETADPVCPTVSGYTLTGRNGFTCNYSKTTTETANPVCPTLSGYTYTGRNGFTCNYTANDYTTSYVTTKTGSYVPADTDTYDYVEVGSAEYVYDCTNSCAFRWIHTYKVYKKIYDTTTKTASCPNGYSNVNGTCSKSTTSTTTKTANCPSGYNNVNGTCTKSTTNTTTKTASCPSGYSNVNGTCTKSTTDKTTKTASCLEGYTKSENTCTKPVTSYEYKDLTKTCPTEYTKTSDGTKCYKEVSSTVTVTGTREVTYYRYRVREYIGGIPDYKWSKSKEDKELLDAGYKLTGRTR